MKDKISIIVPVYNNEIHLKKCLDSIVNQTYKNLEIILINDGSKDASLKIMNSYAKKDERIIIIDKENEGVSKARNDGIKKSTGEYITFVDSDDYIELNEIEEMYTAIKENNVDMVRTNYQVHYKDSDKIDTGDLKELAGKILTAKEIKETFLEKILDGSIPCFVYLFMVKREVLLTTNLFPTDIHMMEDVVLYIDLITKVKSIYVLDKPLYNIFFNEFGATNNFKNYERNILNIILVNKYIKNILKKQKLGSKDNLKRLDIANITAISDFIFKQYLSGLDTISLCKKLSENKDMEVMLENLDYDKINIQRKIIIKSIHNKKINNLKIYFKIRKIIYKLKHR